MKTIYLKSQQMAKHYLSFIVAMFISIGIYAQATKTYSYTMGSSNPLTGATQLKEVDNTTASWTKQTSLGAALSANKWSANITLPFAFKFYGESVTACKVTANGLLTFTTSTIKVPSGNNESLPSTLLPQKTITCYWDQFTAKAPTGTDDFVYTRTIGITPNRQFWIKWNSYEIGNTSGNAAENTCFAIVLEETTNNYYIVDMYKGTPSTLSLSATIGSQYNAFYYKQATASALASATTAYTDNLFYKFTPSGSITDNSISYSYTDLSNASSGATRTFILNTAPSGCSTSISSAKLYASLNLGEDYEYGSNNTFSDSVGADLTVKGYNSSGTVLFTGTAHMVINQTSVEKLYELDITTNYSSISYLTASMSGMKTTTNTNVQSDVSFRIWTEPTYKISVSSTTITLNTVSTTSNPVQFSWASSCNSTPKYEFQLLRLFNEDVKYNDKINKAAGTIDWSKALDLIIENSATSISLHVTEGTGYYTWRVRPIGNSNSGEEANNNNWGTWSSGYAQGASYDLTPSSGYGKDVFYYTQFDASINWIYNRSFTEDNSIGENIIYGDGLGKVKQSQHHLQSDDYVLINQQIYDYAGRPALKSMSGPVARDYFDYEEKFLTTDAAKRALYRAKDFDSTTTYNDPSRVLGGELTKYYSDNNTDKRIPTAEGFPFSRTLFYADGTNRPKEISTPGGAFRIGSTSSGDDRTIKIYYSGVLDEELIRVFGDEAPVDTSVYKVIQVDPNKVITVTYQTVDGKTIATCLADGGDNELLDDIENDAADISAVINGDIAINEYSYYKEKTVTIAVPTTMWATYEINPVEIAATCGDYCSSCDYTIKGYIKENGTVIWDTTITIPASECGLGETYTFEHSFMTDVANYTVGRTITVNNENASSGNTYLEEHQDTMASIMDAHLDENFTEMYSYLESSDVEGFYQYLVDNGYATQDQIDNEEDVTITTACCTIVVPVTMCPPHPCDEGTPDFEALLYDLWENKYGNAFQKYSNRSDVFNYPDNAAINEGSVTFSLPSSTVVVAGDCGKYVCIKIEYTGADGSTKESYLTDDYCICLDDYSISSGSDIANAISSEVYTYYIDQYGDNVNGPYSIYSDGAGTLFVSPNLNYDYNSYFGVSSGRIVVSSPNYDVDTTYNDFGYTSTGSFPFGRGAFNELVGNMIEDGYPCDSLYDYWYALCTAYESAQYDTDHNENDFNIVEAFLKSVGTMYGAASSSQYSFNDTSPGYLSHAHEAIYYTTGTCTECEDMYNYTTMLATDTYDDTRTEDDSLKTWMQFYNCTQTCSGDLTSALSELGYAITECDGTDDIACAEAMVEAVADSCYSLCETRANSFEVAIRAEYAAEGITISEEEVICLKEALIAECQSGCGLTVYATDTTGDGIDDRLDSVGNQYEILAIQQSLTYSFDLRIPTDSTCEDMGYKTISYSVITTEIIGEEFVEEANENLEEFLNKSINYDTIVYGAHIFYGANEIYAENGFSSDPYNCVYTPLISVLSSYNIDSTSYFYLDGTTVYLHYYIEVYLAAGKIRQELDVAVLSLKNCYAEWVCGPLCFKWIVPEVPLTPDTIEISTCEENAADYLMGVIDEQMNDCKDYYLEDITDTYETTCASPSSIDDVLEMGYTLGYFQYTLYYYDRGGNLIETVPPKGVDDQNDSREDSPNDPSNAEGHYHSYKTTYEYNSRKQLVAKETPDGGRTEYYYNDLGQLRFSVNAQQFSDHTYSYLNYDALGRVIESGQASICSTCEITSISELAENVNTNSIPSSGEERTFTEYSNAASVSYTDASGAVYAQEYLTNRISYVYNDEDGDLTTTNDQNYTYYSYDPHGNVKYLIQAVAGLSNKQIGFEYDLISGKVTKVKYQEGQSDQYYYKYTYDADNRLTAAKTSRDNKIWDNDATYQYYKFGPLERTVLGEDKVQGLDYIYTLQGWLKAINHPELSSGYDAGQDGVSGTTNQNIPADAFGMIINYYKGDFNRTSSQFNNNSTTSTLLSDLSADHGRYSSSSSDMKSYYNGLISNTISNNAATLTNQSGKPMVGMFLYDELGRLTQSTVDFFSGSSWNSSNTGSSSDYYEHFQYDENGNITNVIRNGY